MNTETLTPTKGNDKPTNRRRRLLYYVAAACIVTATMQIGSPAQLCLISEGIAASVSKVDPFYVLWQVRDEHQKGVRLHLNYAAEYGGVASTNPHPSGIGLLIGSVFRALRNTIATDWATLLISLLALILGLIVLFRIMKLVPHPASFLLAIPFSGLIALVLKYAVLAAAYPFSCSGPVMITWLAVWPVVKVVLDVRDMSENVEKATNIAERWRRRPGQ